jgi:hypothetical protein
MSENESEDRDLSKSNSNSKEVENKENSKEVENKENSRESAGEVQAKTEDAAKALEVDVDEDKVVASVVDVEVIRALSGFAAEQGHIAVQGIINWTGLDEEVGTEFAKDVLASYSKVIQEIKSNPLKAQGIVKMLLKPEKRGELVAAFLFSIEPRYRNAWMQLLLQTIGCYEIANKTPKIQRAYLEARPTLAEELREVLIKSVKPALRSEVEAIIESLKFFLK